MYKFFSPVVTPIRQHNNNVYISTYKQTNRKSYSVLVYKPLAYFSEAGILTHCSCWNFPLRKLITQ